MLSTQTRFISAALLFTSSIALAGGSVGSGGGSFRDQHNPWFLRNVSSATYCLKIDPATFSASADTARADIQKAIAYWQQQFTMSAKYVEGAGIVKLGGQSFSEVDCAANPDIEFVLGYGGLTPDQLNFFKDPSDPTVDVTGYIGVTVRTSYDSKALRGKGYVYISSDMGAHVYVNDGNLISPAWTKPNLLRYALIHEIGHVFGFPHTGTSIMSEVFLEQILDKNLTYIFQESDIPSFLVPGPNADDKFMLARPGASAWFHAPADATAIRVQIDNPMEFPVYAYTGSSDPSAPAPTPKLIGTFKGLDASAMSDMRIAPGIFIHLVPGQQLFSEQESGFRAFMLGPSFLDFGATANYVPADGSPVKPAYVRVTSNSVTALGMLPLNKFGIVFSYESPVDLMVTQPPSPSTITQDNK